MNLYYILYRILQEDLFKYLTPDQKYNEIYEAVNVYPDASRNSVCSDWKISEVLIRTSVNRNVYEAAVLLMHGEKWG